MMTAKRSKPGTKKVSRAKAPKKVAAATELNESKMPPVDGATVSPTQATPPKFSALDAAARVLEETGRPMGCKELIGVMAAKGYWSSPGGETPAATLYAAILREQKVKGKEARFARVGRGLFSRTSSQE